LIDIQKKINDPSSSEALSNEFNVPVDSMKAEVTQEEPVKPADPNNPIDSTDNYLVLRFIVIGFIIIILIVIYSSWLFFHS